MLGGLYVVFIIHLSLYPYQGWRQIGIGPLEFLSGPWIPIHQTVLWRDITLNILGYIPLGFLLLTGLSELPARFERALAPIIGIGLSFCLEALQTYIPIRVPSKVDWLTNSIGTLVGVGLGIWFIHHTELALRINKLLKSWLIDKAWLGIGVLSLWCFSQLTPSNPTFVSSFWLGNVVFSSPVSDFANALELPTNLLISFESWGPNFTTYAFLTSAWLIGLAQTRAGSPRFRMLLALTFTTIGTPTISTVIGQSNTSLLSAVMDVVFSQWITLTTSILVASLAIVFRLQPRSCGWLAIVHLIGAMVVMLFIPGVHDPSPDTLYAGSGIWNSVISASHWVSELWAFLALGVLAILTRVNPQFDR